ncbi:MAG: type II secretion system F family protein [Patescibacteria group bacterium]|nr:type II secretion system F family protein [Patescibacteria group bacterium]
MLFNYKAIDQDGGEKQGSIDAINLDVAIASLQRRGFVISSIKGDEEGGIFKRNLSFFDRVSNKDVVILSRQMATLFEAQVSALRVFRLLSAETENAFLRKTLEEVSSDLQGGSSISNALAKHPKVFSEFYINMVKSGEESGRLDETFLYLADYLDRTYEVSSKARNALIYPAFVVFTFITVMVLMLTLVIPKISGILKESGQTIPIYTEVILGISDFFVNYGLILAAIVVIGSFFLWRFIQTDAGRLSLDRFKISIPFVSVLYKKLYLARISDNMNTMLLSGIPMIRVLELTSSVIDNQVYKNILENALELVKGGSSVSEALSRNNEIPGIMIQMMKIGEETGELGNILKTLAKFYTREVNNAVDTLVDLIEPVMIVMLGLGVGFLLAAVLIPIYNISAGI